MEMNGYLLVADKLLQGKKSLIYPCSGPMAGLDILEKKKISCPSLESN